jgi:hypothetical protein
VSALRQLRESLLRIPFAAVVVAGFTVCALFPICAQPLGEAGVLLELPFAALWLLTCALVLAHIHRVAAQSQNSLLQFGAPVAIALAYAGLTIYAGGAIGFWLLAHTFPHTAP